MRYTTTALMLSSIVFASSCNRYYYKPNAVNAPLFTKGGQAHLAGAGSIGDGDGRGSTNFFDVQAAVSPINHLGIIGNYSTYSYKPEYPDIANGNTEAQASLVEGGVGGYYAVGKKKVKMVVDLYAGGGVGTLVSDVDMKLTRLFLQPGIGMTSPWFDVAFNLRTSRLRYHDFNAKGRSIGYLTDHGLIDAYNRRIDQQSYIFLEPAITLRAGYKFAKVQFQAAFAQNTGNVYWNYNGARFTVGIDFSLEGLLEMNKEAGKSD